MLPGQGRSATHWSSLVLVSVSSDHHPPGLSLFFPGCVLRSWLLISPYTHLKMAARGGLCLLPCRKSVASAGRGGSHTQMRVKDHVKGRGPSPSWSCCPASADWGHEGMRLAVPDLRFLNEVAFLNRTLSLSFVGVFTKNFRCGDLPASPVAKSVCSQGRGLGSSLWSEN